MAKLTTKKRKALPTSKFALPKERKYPVQDRAHAANAKARAQQQFDKGNLSKGTLTMIDARANKVLGKTKKETEGKESKSTERVNKMKKMSKDSSYKGKSMEYSKGYGKKSTGSSKKATTSMGNYSPNKKMK